MRDFQVGTSAIVLRAYPGEVLASDRNSSTEYRLRGGGGFVPSQGGYVEPPQLDSTTTQSQDLWLRLEDGLERSFVLLDVQIPVLAGQRVVIVLGSTKGTVPDIPVGLLNINSRMWYGLPEGAGLIGYIDQPSKALAVILMWTAITMVFVLGILVWVFADRYGPVGDAGPMTAIGMLIFGFCYWVYTRFRFAASVEAAHKRLLAQAQEDCRHYLAPPATNRDEPNQGNAGRRDAA